MYKSAYLRTRKMRKFSSVDMTNSSQKQQTQVRFRWIVSSEMIAWLVLFSMSFN